MGVWACGWIELTRGFFEVRDELVGFIDIENRAASGARNAADFSLRATLEKHLAGIRIIGMDDDAIGNIAPDCGVRIGRRVVDLGIDAAHSFFGVSCLDGGVSSFGNTHSAHGEEAGRGLGGAKAEPTFASAAGKGFENLAVLQRDDLHALGGGIDEVEKARAIVGVTCFALFRDGGLDGFPV